MNAEKLIFLTDVPGLYDKSKSMIESMSIADAQCMIDDGVISGGMVAKIRACTNVLCKVRVTRIIDGRILHALFDEIEGKGHGTTIIS